MQSILHFLEFYFLWFSSLSGTVLQIPKETETNQHWAITQNWVKTTDGYFFEAVSNSPGKWCQNEVNFPVVLYGAQELLQGNTLIAHSGDKTFERANSVQAVPVAGCHLLDPGLPATWRVYAYDSYFARISYFPKNSLSEWHKNFFNHDMYIGCGTALAILGALIFGLLIGATSHAFVFSIAASALFLSAYTFGTVPDIFRSSFPVLLNNKISDSALCVGVFLLIRAIRIKGLVS